MYNEKIVLNNGVDISSLGLGTWFMDNGPVADAIKETLKSGYLHFDIAQAYGN